MRIEPLTIDAILELLRERAAAKQSSLIIEARIAVSPKGAQLLDVQPEDLLETIYY